MVTDQQVRRLWKLMEREGSLASAAAAAGMDEKTARKYRRLGKLPSEAKAMHSWRTRKDPFAGVWEEVRAMLKDSPGLEAKTIFEDLQRRYPGRFADGQLRTLQRRVKAWRALEGPPKEVFFAQKHRPAELCQSDFTRVGRLEVTIQGQPFEHMLYHFVLTYSNWEWATICFSESFESLSEGLQGALRKLGGVPKAHQTDRLTTAVQKADHPDQFTQRYGALLAHYGLQGRKSQAGHPNELGDAEQRHRRFKNALDQALMLRGSRDFSSRSDYERFLGGLLDRLNSGRRERLGEELKVLGRLPACGLDACRDLKVRVRPSSTIRVHRNVYSVDSRLIGEMVSVRLGAERLEVWHGQRCVESMARLRGEGKRRIQYRHIIDWLVRKPGAFEDYVHRDELFPTSRFRAAYDALKARHAPSVASKQYLKILHLAARESEEGVDQALASLLEAEEEIGFDAVESRVLSGQELRPACEVAVEPVDLGRYDDLLEPEEAL